MFDLGWLELLVIGITALIVVGPKELPQLFRTVGRFFGKIKAMAREFSQSMEEAANESGLKDATKTLNSITDLHQKTKQRCLLIDNHKGVSASGKKTPGIEALSFDPSLSIINSIILSLPMNLEKETLPLAGTPS